MKILKHCLTASLLLLSLHTIAQHSYPINNDSAWANVEKARRSPNGFINRQVAFLRYREEGLKFWYKFPNDNRRYDWLFNTVRRYGGYLLYLDLSKDTNFKSNILKKQIIPNHAYKWPLNKRSLEEWKAIYPQLKGEFLLYCKRNPQIGFGLNSPESNQEIGLLVGELWSFLELSLNKEYRQNNKIDLYKLNNLFTSITNILANEPDSEDAHNRRIRDRNEFFEILSWAFISRYNEYGLNVDDMKGFFNSIIKNNSSQVAQKWALQRSSLFALHQEPLSFKHRSINGDLIDLEKMRGKVVLVDFWSTNCTVCIARMPAIKNVYDKYKTQGFEVISACLNSGDETDRIRNIEQKIGADWPILMIGGERKGDKANSLGKKIWDKYGFWGVPQLLLLNKSGKLVMLNDKLGDGDFEPVVKKLLAENYKSN